MGHRPLPLPPPALSPGGQPLAGFGDRLLAVLIDAAILGGVTMIIMTPVLVLFFVTQMADLAQPSDPYGAPLEPIGFADFFRSFLLPLLLLELAVLALILVLYYVYYVEMMFRSGQTIGKRVMKLRVVPLDPTATLTRAAAAKRYAVEVVAGIIVPFLPYVDGLWQLWDKPYQQTLHDKAAGTIVIKVAP